MKIVIDPFDPKSITAAIRQVNRYEKEFAAKEQEFVRRLKELGVSVATGIFSMADYDGVNDVLIAETQSGSRAAVIAYGETVGFIEFGTGVKFREYDSSGLAYKPPAHGTYGQGKGANPKGWYYKPGEGAAGRHTYGNPPAEAMLTARDTMIEQVTAIAREVWK
jgi:hypothetical protein